MTTDDARVGLRPLHAEDLTGDLPRYAVHGSGDTTIFMLHGAYGDSRYFAPTIERWVDQGLRVVAWDCPGYRSDDRPAEFTISHLALCAARMVAQERTARNFVLGHSMGALISPRLPTLLPNTFAGIILSAASSGFTNRTDEDKERYLKERVAPIAEDGLSVAEYSRGLLTTMMAPGAAGHEVDLVFDVVADMRTDAFLSAMKALTAYDSVPALERLDVPCLLIAGEHDPACTPKGMEAIGRIVAKSELHVVVGAGHYSFAEQSETYDELVLSFLRTHAEASPASV